MVQITIENGDLGLNVRNAINNMFAELYASAGGVSVPGSDTQILFNDGGTLGADAGLTFDKTTSSFAITAADPTVSSGIAGYSFLMTLNSSGPTSGYSLGYVGPNLKAANYLNDDSLVFEFYAPDDTPYSIIKFGFNADLILYDSSKTVRLFAEEVDSGGPFTGSIALSGAETGSWMSIRSDYSMLLGGTAGYTTALLSYGDGTLSITDDISNPTGLYMNGTITDAANGEYAFIGWQGSSLCIYAGYYGSGVQQQIRILNLPTSDPAVADALWNNSGVLSISAG